jgi:CRISPR-associated protein Csm3
MKKINHYVITGTIELLSGMRIGGSDDVLQIGGTDLTCIKDPVTGKPYIPGSSLKGKMRSGLEKRLGKSSNDGSEPCGCADKACAVCRIFGPHKKPNHLLGPTRIRVRDAMLEGTFTIENKTENINDRKTGTAKHPRTVERVAPGAKFTLQIEIDEYDSDSDFCYERADGTKLKAAQALIEVVGHALSELEQTGIGSGTSKGYGHVKIHWDGKVQQSQRRNWNIQINPISAVSTLSADTASLPGSVA